MDAYPSIYRSRNPYPYYALDVPLNPFTYRRRASWTTQPHLSARFQRELDEFSQDPYLGVKLLSYDRSKHEGLQLGCRQVFLLLTPQRGHYLGLHLHCELNIDPEWPKIEPKISWSHNIISEKALSMFKWPRGKAAGPGSSLQEYAIDALDCLSQEDYHWRVEKSKPAVSFHHQMPDITSYMKKNCHARDFWKTYCSVECQKLSIIRRTKIMMCKHVWH